MGLSRPLLRLVERQQQRLDAIAAKRSPVAPGLDREGMPELRGIGGLAELEEDARNRFSPRSAPPDIAAFDARVAQLDARREEVAARLAPLRVQLANADQADADAIAAWLGNGEKGPRPPAVKPALEGEIAELTREHDGLMRASSDVLRAKAQHVERHRARLSKAARRRVDQAHAALVAQLDGLSAARQELVLAREAELWTRVYPAEGGSQMPPFAHLAGGDRQITRAAGLNGVTAVDRLHQALRADCDWLPGATSGPQGEILDGPQAKPGAATWAGSEEHKAALRAERDEYIAEHKRQWGRYPDNV
jgi:ethanolamine utilization microcompartment shell protein EutL